MAFSLYDATVANYLQILGAVGGFLEKSLTHFKEKGVDPAEIVEARLVPDMLPFRFQIVSVAHHSRGAIEAAKNGVFIPSGGKPDLDYAALQALVTEARNELSILTPEVVNALIGRDVTFNFGDRSLPFTAEGFLMSFSLPNFLFPCDHGLRHSSSQGRAAGKTRFHGQTEIEGVREQSFKLQLAPELFRLGLLTGLDVGPLSAYCSAAAQLRQAEEPDAVRPV